MCSSDLFFDQLFLNFKLFEDECVQFTLECEPRLACSDCMVQSNGPQRRLKSDLAFYLSGNIAKDRSFILDRPMLDGLPFRGCPPSIPCGRDRLSCPAPREGLIRYVRKVR